MSMIDYGVVVIKNGKVINSHMFEDMEQSVGWNDEGKMYYCDGYSFENECLNGNYFAYIGDKDFTLGFYKTYFRYSNQDNSKYIYCDLYERDSCKYCKSKIEVFPNGVKVHVKNITDRVDMVQVSYKGDFYVVVYGYGIDVNPSEWNRIKVRYLGKKGARKVDNIYRRYIHD